MTSASRGGNARQRILDAALEGFALHGYDATGVAEICERAGVSKGAFYYHFPSKQALFLELLRGWLGGLEAYLQELPTPGATMSQSLDGIAEFIGPMFRLEAGQIQMFLEFWTQAARNPKVWQETIAPYRSFRTLFSHLVQRGIDEGVLRSVDTDVAAQALVALGVGLLLQAALEPTGVDWGAVAMGSVRILLEGLVAD